MRSITIDHINEFKEGFFKKLFEGIKEDPELSFEIRKDNKVMIYYHKEKILTTSIKKGKPCINILDEKYYEGKTKPLFSKENLHRLTDIRNYFKEAKNLVSLYKRGEEFSIQQNIALGNNSFNDRYLVVDMEWQFSQECIPSGERIKKTRIDLVIVDTKTNTKGTNDIYLAELKLGTGATQGASGTIDHVEKTNEIITNEKACQALVDDVKTILDQKTELGLIEGERKAFKYNQKPKMMLILAYRGEKEKKVLLSEYQKAKKRATELGMEEPKLIMHNALITLKDE